MKKQKHYRSEEEIQKEIERCRYVGQKALADVTRYEGLIADAKLQIPRLEKSDKKEDREHANWLISELPSWRTKAKKSERRATRYLETRMDVLKDTLARFLTNLLPIDGNTDVSVVER